MSRHSHTELAVLGALSVEPMSGYTVRASITETLGHFWSESFGQIYPTLARLESEGQVERDAAGKTSGSRFRLPPRGRDRLVDLLHDPIPTTPPRNGTLLRLFFGGLLGPQECREIVLRALTDAEARLVHLTAVRAEVEREGDPGSPYRLITVAAGEHSARAQVAWAHEVLETLDALAS